MTELFGSACVGVADSIQDHRFVNNFFSSLSLFFFRRFQQPFPVAGLTVERTEVRRVSLVEIDLRECVRRSALSSICDDPWRGQSSLRHGSNLHRFVRRSEDILVDCGFSVKRFHQEFFSMYRRDTEEPLA